MTVAWDWSCIHSRSGAVPGYLPAHPYIGVENLPAYAPDLNPGELVSGWAKYGRLAESVAPDVPALRVAVEAELKGLQSRWDRVRSFLDHTDQSLAA